LTVPRDDVGECPSDVYSDRAIRKWLVIQVESTPNPNATKFNVGRAVGGPATFVQGTDDPMASKLLDLPGVRSVFMTADFVTLSKDVDSSWDDIIPAAIEILTEHFG
jgi:hypothetical protein